MDETSKRLEIAGDIKKLSMTKDDVLVVSFKDERLFKHAISDKEKYFMGMIKKCFGEDQSILVLPPGIDLGIIEKKEVAPWVAFNRMTGELGLPGEEGVN